MDEVWILVKLILVLATITIFMGIVINYLKKQEAKNGKMGFKEEK